MTKNHRNARPQQSVDAGQKAPLGDPRPSNNGGNTREQSPGEVMPTLRTGLQDDGCVSKFDWYQGTVLVNREALLDYLQPSCLLTPTGKGCNGYSMLYEGIACDGTEFTVMAGGNNGAAPNVCGSGGNAPAVAALLRGLPWPHRVTRADSAVDLEGDGVWQMVTTHLIEFANGTGIRKQTAGDWTTSEDDPHGRTLYLGSRKSRAFIRAYEKGKQLGDPNSNWVRVELVVRPDKEQRDKAATISPDDLWGFTGWPRQLASWVLGGQIPAAVSAPRHNSKDELRPRLISMVRRNRRLLEKGVNKYGLDGLAELIQATLELEIAEGC